MRYGTLDGIRNEVALLARLMLVVLFLIFGWSKLGDYGGTVGYMAAKGAPMPALAAIVAIVMEVPVSILIAVGFYTRPLALLMAFYTLATALIGHPYWTMEGAEHAANMINFFKNISIAGGFLLLCLTGPGRYSFDRR